MKNPNVGTDPQTAKAMARRLGNRKRILDLGCGDGVLLEAAARESPDAKRLVGIDLDRERLPASAPPEFEYVAADALRLPDTPTFDGIISNPPYLSVRRLEPRERERLRRDFSTLAGQYDLAFAFVEKAIRLLEPGGRAVFLLPEGLKTRPAAKRLRQLLDQYCRWNTVRVPTRPYAMDVGVEAEILWFDRTEEPRRPAKSSGGINSDWSSRVSVGIATGANSVFIRAKADPWLRIVEPQFIRRFIRGRDIASNEEEEVRTTRREVLIAPYILSGTSLSPADEWLYEGLSRFLDAHRRNLGNGRHRGPGCFIQCPAPALIGSRVAVPEVFREPAASVVRDGVAVLNSAFVIRPRPGIQAEALARALNSDAARPAILNQTRRLGSGYRRITASGLGTTLDELDTDRVI